MRKKVFLFCLFLSLMYVQQVLSWGQKGHRIIAQIAYDNLNKQTQKQVDDILGKHGMVYIANWADEIKSDTIFPNSHDWHYQDIEGDMSEKDVLAMLKKYPQEGGNLFKAMDSLTNVLKSNKNDTVALKFLVHLYGDRFCPMHMGYLSDAGGNKVSCKWMGQSTNLHAIWDTKLIESQGYSYTEYAEFLQNKFAHIKKDIQRQSKEDLLKQSYLITRKIYAYQSQWDGNTYHYIYYFVDDMEKQLYKAGIVLSEFLNQIYL